MFLWVVKWAIVSVLLISLMHYIYIYLRDTLTIPKTRDLIKNPQKRYAEMFSNDPPIDDENPIMEKGEEETDGTDINQLDSIINESNAPKLNEQERDMKTELENFIKGI